MIRIKDYIFNENEIEYIKQELEGLIVCPKAINVELEAIENATFEDIEWNYDNNNIHEEYVISQLKDYENKIKEYEEELTEAEYFSTDLYNSKINLSNKIRKAIEYINNTEEDKEEDSLFIHKKEKSFLTFYKIKNDLLKILKGEENE